MFFSRRFFDFSSKHTFSAAVTVASAHSIKRRRCQQANSLLSLRILAAKLSLRGCLAPPLGRGFPDYDEAEIVVFITTAKAVLFKADWAELDLTPRAPFNSWL